MLVANLTPGIVSAGTNLTEANLTPGIINAGYKTSHQVL